MSVPSISVVIPLYNKNSVIERTVRSVLAQTWKDFEVIVINDGSTDGGPEVVRRIHDPRLRIVDQINSGVSVARNRGVSEARADLIAFLDGDDEWFPYFLEEVANLRGDFPGAAVFATNYLFCDGPGRFVHTRMHGIQAEPWRGLLADYFAIAANSDPPLSSCSVAVKKWAILAVGGFPPGIKSGEDLLTWARLAIRFEIAFSSIPCAVFWRPQEAPDRPGRHDDPVDVAGQELANLLNNVQDSNIQSLRRYISVWHEMRSVVFLPFGKRWTVLREILLSIRYSSRVRLRHVALAALTLLPTSLARMLLRKRRQIVSALRGTGISREELQQRTCRRH